MSQGFFYLAEAGKKLAHLHADFDSVRPWPVEFRKGGFECPDGISEREYFRVEKMILGGEKRNDRSEIIYNHHIVIHRIPEDAWEYEVNGKPALKWVMEQQKITTDRQSGIVNDPNRSAEMKKNPKYILRLVTQVIRVSIETTEIVRDLDRRYNWDENNLVYTEAI